MMNRNLMLVALVALIAGVGLILFSNLPTTSVEAALRNGQEVVIDDFTVPVILQSDQCEFATDVSKMNSPWFPNGERIVALHGRLEPDPACSYVVSFGQKEVNLSLSADDFKNAPVQTWFYNLKKAYDFSNVSKILFGAKNVKRGIVVIISFHKRSFIDERVLDTYLDAQASREDFESTTASYTIEILSDTNVLIDLEESHAETQIALNEIRQISVLIYGLGTATLSNFRFSP